MTIKIRAFKTANTIKANANIKNDGSCSEVFAEVSNKHDSTRGNISFFTNSNSNKLTVITSDNFIANRVLIDPKEINFKFILLTTETEVKPYAIDLKITGENNAYNITVSNLVYGDVKALLNELRCLSSTEETPFNAEEFNQSIVEKLQQLHAEFTEFLAKNNAELIE